MKVVQITVAVAAVLRAFVDEPDRVRYGYDLGKQTGFASGTLYPILARLEKAGWLVSTNEAAVRKGRPSRLNYQLTDEGATRASEALVALSRQLLGPSTVKSRKVRASGHG